MADQKASADAYPFKIHRRKGKLVLHFVVKNGIHFQRTPLNFNVI